jgi:hypothetical protein
MPGRWPDGPEYIDKLEGSGEAKQRFKAILDTLYGRARTLEVCAQLNISVTRFQQLREACMQGGLTAIESRPAGRPRRTESAETEEIRMLRQRVRELEQALLESQVREEIALVLPHQRRADDDRASTTCVEKKMRPLRVKIRKSR